MPLPEKDYYSLHEIAARWKIPLLDLQYYATHGEIETLIWLHVGVATFYQMKELQVGLVIPVPTGLKAYRDYAVVPSDDLRQVFRSDTALVRNFIHPETLEQIEIHESHPCYEVRSDDLVISRLERNRFEQFHALLSAAIETVSPYSKPPSFAGRPSTMHQIKQHFLERCRKDQLLPSLQQEADYLSRWAEDHIREGQPPKTKAIMNALRSSYREHRPPVVNTLSKEAIC